jgi:hypothetical protein
MEPHLRVDTPNQEDDEMPQYMLLFYAPDADAREREERDADLPRWRELIESVRADGKFIATGRLEPSDTATTMRMRDGETEIVDGPFATTKEILGGYLLAECADLDDALEVASRVPLVRYGSVEVRPLADLPVPAGGSAAA